MNSSTNQRGRNRVPRQEGEKCNEAIRAKEVLVIGENGEQMGVLLTSEALSHARAAGLDLVEVDPNASPPVCRVMNFGKKKYEQRKRKQEAKKRQPVTQTKEIRMRSKTDEHDYQTKLRHIVRFLEEGYKCRVAIIFRGREMMHKERAEKLLARVVEDTQHVGKVEQDVQLEGKALAMLLGSVAKKQNSA